MIMRFIQGFCMALADSVPGVSGGTIAFLLGFYDDFISSLNNIVSKDKEKRNSAFKFLIKIGIGWATGFVLAILFIASVFEKNIYQISSLFIGFIVFAIPIIVMEEKECLKKWFKSVFIIVGAIIVAGITFFSNESILSEGVDLRIGEVSIGILVFLFIAGMIAISAMVLPGISGSTILMIFGLYIPIITAIKDILHFEFEYIPALCFFGMGVIVGALLVVKLIKKMLEKYRGQTVYLIIGLMVGSVYSIAMGPTTLKNDDGVLKNMDMLSFDNFSWLFFVIGGIIIFGLQALKYFTEKKVSE